MFTTAIMIRMSILSVISEKQLIANRENGKKGGVKTLEGREISKYNAFRHGMLSTAAVLRKGDLRESEGEFRALCAKFYEDVQPVGMIEQALVDKLIMLYWRERRIVRGERAWIECQSIGERRKLEWDRLKKEHEYRIERGGREWLSEKEWKGAREDIGDMIMQVEDDVLPLSDFDMEKMKKLMFTPPLTDLVLKISTMNKYVADYAKKRGKTAARCKKLWGTSLFQGLTELATSIDRLLPIIKREEKDKDKAWAETEAFSFENENLERFQRYESHLHRMFMQTLHELQRVQSARLGRPAPLAAALDMTIDS